MQIKTLSARLAALEKQIPARQSNRVIRLVCNDEDEVKARELAKAQGYDPDNGDICIIRLIVPALGQPRTPREPQIIGKAGEWRAAS